MKAVRKKILPCYFEEVVARRKNFEVRKDEDDIHAGDTLVLCEYTDHYTGREVFREVKCVLRKVPGYGLKEGYCIIGF